MLSRKGPNAFDLWADLDHELVVKHNLDTEVERYNRFQSILGLKHPTKGNVSKVDPKSYTRYLLRSGSVMEKRELLGSIKDKLILIDKKLSKLENIKQ